MRRLVAALLLVSLALLTAGQAIVARQPDSARGLISAPRAFEPGVAGTLELRLPLNAAAVQARVLLDRSVAEVVGIAPLGKGTALEPVEIDGGFAVAAYGLTGQAGSNILRIVVAAAVEGSLGVRVVIDAAADAQGNRISIARSRGLASVRVGIGGAQRGAPAESARPQPVRAAGATRDLVADGVVGRLDLDVVRAGWARSQSQAACLGALDDGDANGDGCVDVLDLQAVAAAQGRQVGQLRPSGEQTRAAESGRTLAVTAAANAPFVVTSTSDTPDDNPGDGLCRDSQGRCTLRAAVTESNWQSGENRIEFNLSGNAPVLIQLSSSRSAPLIQDRSGGVVIDGYSQPGSRVNTATHGSNAIPGVEIRGNAGSPRGQAFRVTSANNTIRGFVFTNHYDTIFFDTVDAHHNQVVGNWFGYTTSGQVHSYRGHHGVRLNNGAHHNQVGSASLADRNVMGNSTHPVDMYGPGTDFNVVQGNLFCVTPSGTGTASCSTAIDHNFGPKNNLLGGPNPGERNVIGTTSLNGIEISHGWDPDRKDTTTKWQNNNNRVIGNWIGFRADGSYNSAFRSGQNNPNSNDQNGVNVYDGSNFNLVEGNIIASVWDGINLMSPNSTGNIVRNNLIGESPQGQPAPFNRYGIHVRNATKSHVVEGNTIRNGGIYGIGLTNHNVLWIKLSRNIISDMNGTAIYLAPNPNNSAQGANNLLPAPVITSATSVRASGTGIAGATVEVYRASRNAGQSGLPIEYLGSTVVGGNGTWTMPIVVQDGQRVTALQINPANNTSALGANVTAQFETPPPGPDAGFSASQRAGTLTVDFSDTSTNTPAQWSWDFGDGTSSIQQNPTKTYAQAGDYNVSLTVTNGGGSDSTSQLITVAPLPSGTTHAADGFGRTQSGWGSADLGGSYSLQGQATNYAVGNGVGTMQVSAANQTRHALLSNVSATDVDIRFRVAVNKVAAGGNYLVYAVARRTGNSEYRPRVVFNSNGTIAVNASVLSNGSESSLGAPVVVPGLAQAADSWVWFRAQVTGTGTTTIRVKAWADGQAEPAGWTFTATNSQASLQGAGSVGLRVWLGGAVSNAPVVLSFDDYAVTSAN